MIGSKFAKNSWKLDRVDKTRCTWRFQAKNRCDVTLANHRAPGVWLVLVLQCTCFWHQSYQVYLILAKTQIQTMWSQTVKQRKTEQNTGELIRVGKSNANVPDTSAQQTRLPRIRNTENVIQIKQKEFWDKAEYKWHKKYTRTCWRGADDCCTDETIWTRETHPNNGGRRKRKRRKQGTKIRNRTYGVGSNKSA